MYRYCTQRNVQIPHKGWARQYLSPKETDKELQAEKQAAREEENQGKRVEMGLQVTPERRNL